MKPGQVYELEQLKAGPLSILLLGESQNDHHPDFDVSITSNNSSIYLAISISIYHDQGGPAGLCEAVGKQGGWT